MAAKNFLAKAVPKSRRGIFTAKAKRAGKSVQGYAKKVLKKGSKASTKTKREAVFAERAKMGF